MPPPFVELRIVTDQALGEKIVAILSQIGFEGFWEDESVLKCYISSSRWDERTRLETESTIRLIARSNATPLPQLSHSIVEDQNWNEQWEKTIQPIRVTDRITIAPTWNTADIRPGDILLRIDPKMSFGTGYHETTRLVLRLMEKHILDGESVLDVGTGTGVLAIAAMKLGAASAVGVDPDEWSYSNAMENTRVNGVDSNVRIILGDIASVPDKQFDLLVANIQLNVIVPILPRLREFTKRLLILSGLLDRDRDAILNALDLNDLVVVEEMQENEWIAIAASHR